MILSSLLRSSLYIRSDLNSSPSSRHGESIKYVTFVVHFFNVCGILLMTFIIHYTFNMFFNDKQLSFMNTQQFRIFLSMLFRIWRWPFNHFRDEPDYPFSCHLRLFNPFWSLFAYATATGRVNFPQHHPSSPRLFLLSHVRACLFLSRWRNENCIKETINY